MLGLVPSIARSAGVTLEQDLSRETGWCLVMEDGVPGTSPGTTLVGVRSGLPNLDVMLAQASIHASHRACARLKDLAATVERGPESAHARILAWILAYARMTV